MKSAIIIIGVQQGLLGEGLYRKAAFLEKVGLLLKKGRELNIPIIYIRHQDEELLVDSEDWQIYQPFSPQEEDCIFDKKYNSIFKETSLHDYLQTQGISRLILAGLQTDYCIDTSIKVGFELGYDLRVLSAGTSTVDSPWISATKLLPYYEAIWHGRFAQVLPLETILK